LLRGVTRTWPPAESPRHEEVIVRQQPVDAPLAALPHAQLASAALTERGSLPDLLRKDGFFCLSVITLVSADTLYSLRVERRGFALQSHMHFRQVQKNETLAALEKHLYTVHLVYMVDW